VKLYLANEEFFAPREAHRLRITILATIAYGNATVTGIGRSGEY
jgi:hypothetical protein